MVSTKHLILFFLPLLSLTLADTALCEPLGQNQCVLCHTNEELIDTLTEDAIIFGEDAQEVSDLQQGSGYLVKQAPFDLYEKILVHEDFLSTPHGQIPCQLCHLGDPDSSDPEAAHRGMVADPSINSEDTCGQCHGDITESAINSLHINPAPLYNSIDKRCSKEQADTLKDTVLKEQCLTCHQGSCGSCHVSRPKVVGGGLRSGHLFKKTPDFRYQCLPCHTHPTGTDFIGKNGKGDVHYRKYKMTCSACHSGEELHASAEGAENRYHVQELPKCIDCHGNILKGDIPEHTLHKDTVSCSVCHSAPYQNCSSCHVGTDENGTPYSQSSPATKGFKIGLNPEKEGPRYVLMREIGVHRNTFNESIGGMTRFSALPTYKRASPHTIQRRTWQTADCNHCHGNKELFLTQESVPFDSLVANRHIVLKDQQVPGKVQPRRSFILFPIKPLPDMRVSAEWLNSHQKDKNIIILDTRTKAQYEQGHIPGSYHLCFCLFRTGADSTPPYMMLPPEELAKIFGGQRLGLSPEKRIVIYDDGHSGRGIAFLALKMMGHTKISFLDGNLDAWRKNGYKLAKGKAPTAKPRKYPFNPQQLLVNNQDIIKSMGSGQAIVVDVRNAAQHNGDMKRDDIARKGGSIPESLNFPLQTLMGNDGKFHPVERLSWLLSTAGITPSQNREIFATCNTNMLAAELYMVLSYLGYGNVKVHDGSWAEWAAEFE